MFNPFTLAKCLLKPRKQQEWLLWCHEDSGNDQVGRPVEIDGRRGKVVDGTELMILVEWE